ncbi:PQQ-dependent sugar dehydrogenase [Ascidiimonas sp. W6]|uniref:PQQ-dependent sugar dehydrogenase n=1 Tax=Ascidiimonas meishanensis TaxID=3128903 RepID=UPI0030EC90EF
MKIFTTKRILYVLFLSLFLWKYLSLTPKDSEIKDPEITRKLEAVMENKGVLWGMDFLPDKSLLVTDKAGSLIHFKNGKQTVIKNLPPIYQMGQGGLLDVRVHPNYENNGWIYITFASSEGGGEGGNTALMRGKINNERFVDKELLYKAVPNSDAGQHFGSRIEFDNDGYLYFTIGDRGNRDVNPQDIKRDGGKVYRLNDDGSIPNDNPFVNEAGAKKAVFSYGHRNPQGMTLHPETGELWTHEHGPRGGDEINIIKKGKNYGWPLVTYGINYIGTSITDNTSLPGMEDPLHHWTPSIAPSGMAFVNGKYYPEWKGDLLVGSLSFQYLEHLKIKNNKVMLRERIFDGIGRVRNVKSGPDGIIYISIEGKGIFKLVPNAK